MTAGSHSTVQAQAWPPFYWTSISFLGGLFLMLNHFHDQGIRYPGSEALFRILAIRVSPVLLCASGILAMRHARGVPSEHSFNIGRLVISSLTWCAIAYIPLILLESALFPVGHGMSQGVFIAHKHLPFVGVFLAGLWSVSKIYRKDRRKLLRTLLAAPAGFLFGSCLVYICVFMKHVYFHWERCKDAENLVQFLKCFF